MTSKFKLYAVTLAALAVCIGLVVDPHTTKILLPGLFTQEGAVGAGVVLVALGGILDVFGSDAFGVVTLTDAINQQPFSRGRAGEVAGWSLTRVATTTIAIENLNGVLSLVNPTARGGPGDDISKKKRTLRNLTVPHYQRDDGIMADEVQGIRAFGQESQVQTVMDVVNARLAEHARDFDVTLEHQRVGAIKGIILNGDGSTLYNLFTEFSVSQQSEVDFNLDGQTANGAVRTTCSSVIRMIAKTLGGQPFTGVHALCSAEFWDALIANVEVRASYLSQQEASQLRDGVAYQALNFGGITFEEYRGGVGTEEATGFIDANKAHFFPVGVPDLFRTVYAPADYIETVNTLGLPRYAKQYPMPNDKGVILEMQMNALNYCTRPRVLIKGKTT